VHVDLSSSKKGAYYRPRGPFGSGKYIVLGNGYDDAATLIHEANHARYDKGYRSSAFNSPGRGSYVSGKIHEETDGTVQAILGAKEFRAAGHSLPAQPGETEYDNAYRDAKTSGASDADAEQAGWDAVEQKFWDKGPGGFRASTNNKPYPDHYGDEWNTTNLCWLYPWCH